MKKDNPTLPTCDLHGLTLSEAKKAVRTFLFKQISEKTPVVKIITGKTGHGNEPVLMTQISEYVASLGFHPDYDAVSDSSGNLEKGSFSVNLRDAVNHFERQESELDNANRVITPEDIERLSKAKEEEPVIEIDEPEENPIVIAPVEPPAPPERKTEEKVKRGKINNIIRTNSFQYKAELKDGRKTRVETFDTVSDLKKRLEDGSFQITDRWDKEMLQWEIEESEREKAKPEPEPKPKPKRKYHYKGHKS